MLQQDWIVCWSLFIRRLQVGHLHEIIQVMLAFLMIGMTKLRGKIRRLKIKSAVLFVFIMSIFDRIFNNLKSKLQLLQQFSVNIKGGALTVTCHICLLNTGIAFQRYLCWRDDF